MERSLSIINELPNKEELIADNNTNVINISCLYCVTNYVNLVECCFGINTIKL